MKKPSQIGFSALELLIVISIGLILMAMVAPLVSTALNMYRLRGAGGDLVTLLQSARMRSVTADQYFPVNLVLGPQAPNAPNPFNAYVDLNGDGNYNRGEPAVAFNPLIAIRPAGAGPNPNNLYQQFLPNINPGQVVINPNAWGPTFGPRGLPCQATVAVGGTCSYTSQAPNPPGLPIAFEIFMQNVQTGIWEAVTVNPAGRVRQWHYNLATNSWQPLN
jgi:type II secretory pathway pseudopilin PulG